MIETLADELRFTHLPEVQAIRTQLVTALTCGDGATASAAWRRYQESAEHYDTGSDRQDKIKLILAKALIWQEAGEPVRYLQELLDAETFAGSMRFTSLLQLIGEELQRHTISAAYLQALGQWDNAIAAWIELEQDPGLTNQQRGLLKLHLAECYRNLLQAGTDDADAVRQLLSDSLQSALAYLEGTPEQGKAILFLDQLSHQGQPT